MSKADGGMTTKSPSRHAGPSITAIAGLVLIAGLLIKARHSEPGPPSSARPETLSSRSHTVTKAKQATLTSSMEVFHRVIERDRLEHNGAYPTADMARQAIESFAKERDGVYPTAAVVRGFIRRHAEEEEMTLASSLGILRQALERYAKDHDGELPTFNIVNEMASATNSNGAEGAGKKGRPYLRDGFPDNPIRGTGADGGAVHIISIMPDAPTGEGGWIYATGNGEFRANVDGVGPTGIAYFEL